LESRTELRLPAAPIAPALARAGIRSITTDLPDRAQADVALLASEVVTNAVRHGSSAGDDIVVRLDVGRVVHVEVVDSNPVFPSSRLSDPISPIHGGWGLFLLDSVADAWGVDDDGRGKKVWFELDANAA
jgi:anti-sigma regulatory factor (Ser/Thr protein kinase)